MSKKNIITLIVTIIIFIGALAIFIYAHSLNPSSNSSKNPEVSTTTDSTEGQLSYFYDIDGSKLTLNNFSGKPSAILLWKSDNAKSYDIITLFQKYYDEYKNSINFLAINVNESDIDFELIDNVKAAGFSIPIYFDNDLTLNNKFNYEKTPHLIFMEKDGAIAKEFSETINEDTFQANLDLLAEKN